MEAVLLATKLGPGQLSVSQAWHSWGWNDVDDGGSARSLDRGIESLGCVGGIEPWLYRQVESKKTCPHVNALGTCVYS